MNVKMDVDDDNEDPLRMDDKMIKIHPLVLINMSDHYTRSMMWMVDQSVVSVVVDEGEEEEEEEMKMDMMGLLYGTTTEEGVVSIVDAGEIQDLQTYQTKMELHQKVFPHHQVVGWYRISNKEEPTQQDLQLSSSIFHNNNNNNNNHSSLLFLLFHPNLSNTAAKTDDTSSNSNPLPVVLTDSLPLTLFHTPILPSSTEDHAPATAAVFVNLDFEMTTLEPERIAIETVFTSSKQQHKKKNHHHHIHHHPPNPYLITQPSAISCSTTSNNNNNNNNNDHIHNHQLTDIQRSQTALQERLEILHIFLQQTYSKQIPTNYKLLRQVNTLLDLHIPFHDADLQQEYQHMMFLSYLATMAKTTFAIQSYTDKYRKLAAATQMGGAGCSKTKTHLHHPWRTNSGTSSSDYPPDNTKIT